MKTLGWLMLGLTASCMLAGMVRAQDVITPENPGRQETAQPKTEPAPAVEPQAPPEETVKLPPDEELAAKIQEISEADIDPKLSREEANQAVNQKLDSVVSLSDQYFAKYPAGKQLQDVRFYKAQALYNIYRNSVYLKQPKRELRDQAMDLCATVIKEAPKSAGALKAHGLRLAEHRQRGRFAEGVAEAQAIADNWPLDLASAPKALMQVWDCSRRMNDAQKADQALKTLAEKYPDTPEGRKAKGILLRPTLLNKKIDLIFTAPDQTAFKLSDFPGKVVIVFYWAGYDPASKQADVQLKLLNELYAPQGLVIIGVNMDYNRNSYEKAVAELAPPWKQAFDGKAWDSPAAVDVGVSAFPSNLILDRSGKVRYMDQWDPELRRIVPQLIQEK